MLRNKKYKHAEKEINNIVLSATTSQKNENVENILEFQSEPDKYILESDLYDKCISSDEYLSDSDSNTDNMENVSNAIDSEEIDIQNHIMKENICTWSVKYNISRVCLNDLLDLLRIYHPFLPKDSRALKTTPRKNNNIIPMGQGTYCHTDFEENYRNFVTINAEMKPSGSTQTKYENNSVPTQIKKNNTKPSPYSFTIRKPLNKIEQITSLSLSTNPRLKNVSLGPSTGLSQPNKQFKFIPQNNCMSPIFNCTQNNKINPINMKILPSASDYQLISQQKPASTPCEMQPDSQIEFLSPTSNTTVGEPNMEIKIMVKALLQEVKLLKSEVKENRCKCLVNGNCDSYKTQIKLNLPASSVEEFKTLESEIKLNYDKEKLLLQHLNMVSGTEKHEKFTRSCLKLLITDEAACNFSYHGQHQNIAIKSFTVINILKNFVLNKFLNSRAENVETVIKKWFQYAKDRHKRKPSSK